MNSTILGQTNCEVRTESFRSLLAKMAGLHLFTTITSLMYGNKLQLHK